MGEGCSDIDLGAVLLHLFSGPLILCDWCFRLRVLLFIFILRFYY